MNLITQAFPEFVGKKIQELYDHLKKEGYKLAGEKELEWLMKNEQNWDKNNYYYFFGDLRIRNVHWYVPLVNWFGNEFDRDAFWLDGVWDASARVVLIEEIEKTTIEKIIQNYAHDYRDVPMSEPELKKVLESFSEEIINNL